MAVPRLPKKQCPCDHLKANVKKTSKFQKNDLPSFEGSHLVRPTRDKAGVGRDDRGEMKTRINL